jgi:kynurenine formamidase
MALDERTAKAYEDRYLVDVLIFTLGLYLEHHSYEYRADLKILKAELLRRLDEKKVEEG